MAVFVIAGCSGGGSGSGSAANSGPMFVQTCSLGCSSGAGGDPVSCGIAVASPNSEIAVYFSEPVDPTTVSTATLQLVDVNSGQVPIGTRFVDPHNPRRVVFRPSVTFDITGTPSFGFEAGTTYRITIPGEAQGDNPPFIESVAHKRNRSRLQCDIQTTAPVVDLVPGPPTVSVSVDLAIVATPDPTDHISNQPAEDAVDVWRDSTITLVFNDVMNPATLVNQATHQPTFLSIRVDADGNLSTIDDQDPWPGTYDLALDLDNLTTTVVYTPTLGLPSGGAAHNRRIIVEVPVSVQDLAQNPVANFGIISFVPETTTSGAVVLPDADGENFTDTANLDIPNSSADWGSGRLARGYGGGSGRLGRLRVTASTTVTLNTDSQSFPLPGTPRDLLDNLNPALPDYDPNLPEASWPALVITDGAFEFSSITIDAGGVLQLSGSRPARLFSRGAVNVAGIIDVAGVSNPTYDSSSPDGQPGGAGGPAGGRGGAGGDRPDNSTSTGTNGLLATPTGGMPAAAAGISNPGAIGFGRGGVGIDLVALGAGSGGSSYPVNFPTSRVTLPPDVGDLGLTNPVGLQSNVCYALMVSTPGGGGGYALHGGAGVPMTVPGEPVAVTGAPNLPPIVVDDQNGDGGPGGAEIQLEPPDPPSDHTTRRLAFENGALRGGSGGGGGGTSLFRTTATAVGATNPICQGTTDRPLNAFFDHSAGGGGGGGGALQLASGKQLTLTGSIDASGGAGGSGRVFTGSGIADRTHYAAPAGGGSGGAVRLQGLVVSVAASTNPGVTGHVDVSGGTGGATEFCWLEDELGSCIGRGGDGSPGLIRIEDTTGLLTRLTEASKLLPYNAATDLESRNWLSVGAWALPRRRPESFSGAVSCWMTPPGSFFLLTFASDDLSNPNPNLHTFGWNMEVLYDDGGPSGLRAINYRGPDVDSPFDPNTDLETLLHNNLNYGLPASQRSYFAVRFQGVRLRGDFTGDLCNVNLNANAGTPQIVADSLTTWVRHPAQLNLFTPRPNAVRFTVVFDTTLETPGSVASFIRGVRNLKINSVPD